MSNIHHFLGNKRESKDEVLENARQLVSDLESGKVTGFLAIAIDATDASFVYSGSSAMNFTRLTAMGMATRLQFAAAMGELDSK